MAQTRVHVDKAIADATRGRIAAVRAEGACARMSAYRVHGLRALEKSGLEVAALAAEHAREVDLEADEEINVMECIQNSEGQGLLRMDDCVLMLVSKSSCILQTDDEGEVFQVQFDKFRGEEQITWVCGTELQVNLRQKLSIVHLGRKIHVVFECDMERVTIIYDEGPVKQVTLTEDGNAGVRLRDEEQDTQAVSLEQAKSRRAEVVALKDEVKESIPSVQEAVTAAEAMFARAKLAHAAAVEKEQAFKTARAEAVSKQDGDGPVDVSLKDGFLAKVSSKRVEAVQLPDKFNSAQVHWGNDSDWTWACDGGIISARADGATLVQLTDEMSSKMKMKVGRVQLMPTGERIVAFEDGSHVQFVKENAMSFHRGPITLVLSDRYCHWKQDSMCSRLDEAGHLLHEEKSGLSWALHEDELVMLSTGHALPTQSKDEKPSDHVTKKKQAAKDKEYADDHGIRQEGFVEDAASGGPLVSASVHAKALSTIDSDFSITCTTDSEGRFELERTEEFLVYTEKTGFASDLMRINAHSLAFCIRLWPLSVSQTFESQSGATVTHEDWSVQVGPGAVKSYGGSPHTGVAQLDLSVPSTADVPKLYVAIADKDAEKNSSFDAQVKITFKTLATLRSGASFPNVWMLGKDATRMQLPEIKRKSFVFRSVFGLPGIYVDPQTCSVIAIEVKASVRTLLQRVYQGKIPGKAALLDEPRLKVDHSARELTVCGIVDVAENEVPEVTPLLSEEAKKEGPLQSALDKCKIKMLKELRLETTYEEVVDWISSGIYVDGIEIPSVDDEVLMKAHAEVQMVQSLKNVSAGLSRTSGLAKELEAASKLKAVPETLARLSSACLSLFTDVKKTAEQIGGFNHFRAQVKSGLLGRCSYLNPYEVSERVIQRTKKLANLDETKLQSDYPAAACLAAWLREFVTCSETLHTLGVAVKNKKKGYQLQRNFLDVSSAVPALTSLLDPPKQEFRIVEFTAPMLGWWTVDFDSWRAAGGGVAAAKALA